MKIPQAIVLAGSSLVAALPLCAADVEITGNVTPNPAITPNWTVGGGIQVGASDNSTGILEITNNGSVNSDWAVLGAGLLSNGSATVRGRGFWKTTGDFTVGSNGTGALLISGNGRVEAGAMNIGNVNTGVVNVRDWATLEVAGALAVGKGGSGTLRIGESASVAAGTVSIAQRHLGHTGSFSGLIEVNGGTLDAGMLYLANTTSPSMDPVDANEGTLKITGGNVSVSGVGLGALTSNNSKGTLAVSGGNLSIGGDLYLVEVAGMGNGINFYNSISLELSGSGTVSNGNSVIAAGLHSTKAMAMTGGTWINTGSLTLGYFEGSTNPSVPLPMAIGGTVAFEISGTAAVSSVGGVIVGDSTVTMNGGSWTNTGSLLINGSALEMNDATMTSAGATLLGSASIEVNGGSWIDSSSITIGGSGVGNMPAALRITGGEVSSVNTTVHTILDVSGGTFSTSGSLSIGSMVNDAFLEIRDEGVVSSAHVVVGDYMGTGRVNANGGTWTTSTLTVGDRGGTGTLDISGSAQVTATNGVVLSGTTPITELAGNIFDPPIVVPATGVLNLNGGQLNTHSITKVGEAGTVNFNGTIVQARQTRSQFISGFDAGDLNIESGGAIFHTNGFNVGIFSALSGSGGLVKTGSGMLLLAANNSYEGGTTIQEGTLQLATVDALGSTDGHVSVEGGTLDIRSFGATIGTLSGNAEGIIRTGANGNRTLTIHQGESGTFAGRIEDGAGQIAVTKVGTGTLHLTGASSHSGGTELVQGITQISGEGSLGSGTVIIREGTLAQAGALLSFVDTASAGTGTYIHSGATETNAFGGAMVFYDTSSGGSARLVANTGTNGGRGGIISFTGNSDGGTAQVELYGNGRVTISAHNPGTVTIGSLSGDGSVILGSNHLAIGANNLSTTFTGTIFETGSITKVGTGTLTLAGHSTYSGGTEIQSGTLVIADVGAEHSALGTGAVSVGMAGRLSGVGTVLGDTIVAGSLSPGNSPGALHFGGALTLDSTAIVQMELSDVSRDFISVDGLLTYNGILAITFSGEYLPLDGEAYDLFDAAFVASGSHFDAITFDVAGYWGAMNYETGVLTITTIPEPSTYVLAVIALSTIVRLRRRESRH